jgi:hypothetical protein
MKTCTRCGLSKPLDLFPAHRSSKNGIEGTCKSCKVAVATAWRKANRQRYNEQRKAKRASEPINSKRARERRETLLTKYGLTAEQYEAMVQKQGGRCLICQNLARHRLCVDHDHDTGEVRGLLCRHCNSGLGHFKDDEHLILVAMKYLERYRDGVRRRSQHSEKPQGH